MTNVILAKLSECFIPKRNKIYERYVFNSRSQRAYESFDQFLTVLRKLAATCEFGTLEDEMPRDRIVTGLQDHGFRKRLLRKSTLTLQRLLTFVERRKWQPVSDAKWSNLVLFTSLAKRRNVAHARTHEESHVPRARANIVVTLMQPETAPPKAKRVQDATRKIAWLKFISPPLNKVARSLNMKERSLGNISD